MAPSELQPPFNYADGGAVGWAGDTTVYNTQSQIGNMLATPGGFSGMSKQFTEPSPMAMAEGGSVDGLASRLAHEFSKRGLDMNKMIAHRKAYAYGGDVRGGDNPGGLRGDTGAYSGRSGGSEAGFAARAGDTPGFGSGGDRSVGGGGGYGATSEGISGGGDRGGSDRGGDRAATSPSFLDTISNVAQNLIGITPAQAGTFDVTGPEYQSRYQFNPVPTRSAFEQALDEANVKETLAEAEANAPFARTGFPTGLGLLAKSSGLPAQFTQPAAQTTTFNKDQSGIVPVGVWTGQQMSMPSLRDAAEQARIQAAKAAEAAKPDTFFSDLQRVNDKLNAIRGMDTSNLVGSGRGVAGPTAAEIAAAAPPRDQFFTDIDRVNAKLDAIRNMNQPVSQPDQTENLIGSGRGVSGPTSAEISAASKSPFSAYNNAVVQGTRSPFEAVVESVTKSAAPDEQGAMVDAATKANIQRRNDVYSYTPPSSFDPITQKTVTEEAQSQPAKSPLNASSAKASVVAPATKTAQTTTTAPATTTDSDTTTAPVTTKAPVKTATNQVAAQAAPVAAVAAKKAAAPTATTTTTTQATQPADQGILSKIMSDINNANAKRIAELEKKGEFAGGSKADVAAALNVDPSQLQSRIVNYDGQQKVDYFTKGLDQVLNEMISGPFKALGNLFGGGNYDLKNGYSITPSGDVVPTPVYTPPTGGGGGMAQAPAPVQAAAAPAVTTPVSPALPQALASFKRKYVPLTNYAQYGYGPESALYEYTAAEGGPVGPLSQKRK